MTEGRYPDMFARLEARAEGAFIPFATLGDPSRETSGRILELLIDAGADALELGLPFSDPVADGPVIQAAAARALAAGIRLTDCWHLIRRARERAPELPIGVLLYTNLVVRRGIKRFYAEASDAGVDSVLIADLPVDEAAPFVREAAVAGIAPVFILPPNASPERLARIARATRGYTYVTTRGGVTGEDARRYSDLQSSLEALAALGAPPAVLGFGISGPDQVRAALQAGAAGAISGSGVVRRIAERRDDLAGLAREVTSFVREMKDATRGVPSAG